MKRTAVVLFVVALFAVGPASAQNVKTFGSNPNPIREYGKAWAKPNPIREYRLGGAHRAF